MATFRIFIADDHEVVRKGLMSLLQAQPDWEVCGEAADGREAVEKAQQLKPDVVILDIGMPSLNGLEATRQILKTNPQARVLILTLHDSDQVVREVLNAGARGFLLKSDAARDLVAAVEALRRRLVFGGVAGASPISSAVMMLVTNSLGPWSSKSTAVRSWSDEVTIPRPYTSCLMV